MRLKTLLSRSLLVAVGLCIGASAWSQETTTLLEYGTSDVAWSTTNLANWTAGGTPTISTDGSYVGITGGNGSYATSITTTPTANAIINVTAVWRGRSNTGRHWSDKNGSYFRFGNIVVAQNDQDKQHGYTFKGLDDIANVTTFTAGSYRKDISSLSFLLIEMEINTATNTLTSFSVKSEDGKNTYASAQNVTLSDANYTTVAFGYQKSGSVKTSNAEDLKSVKVTQTTQAVTSVDYTVKFQDTDGNTIKKDTTYANGVVGSVYTATEADMATLYSTDGTKKYVYKSGNNTETVASSTASENVITLVFDAYTKTAYTVTAQVDGADLTTIASGEAFLDGTETAYWSKYVEVGGKWYETSAPYGVALTSDAVATKVTFTASDISYFVEGNVLNGYNPVGTATGTQY